MNELTAWIEHVIQWLVTVVDQLGIAGIFIMTFLESTFMPIPSELTMVPAGYLVQQGQMNGVAVFVSSVLGTVSGAFFNYLIARRYGRWLFLRYGKYFLMTPEKLVKLETFFANHGTISTFTGRLIPGIRHYISFPAGLAKMDVRKFLIYTTAGGALWMTVLITLGYHIGKNKELVAEYMPMIKLGVVAFVALLVLGYVVKNKLSGQKKKAALEGRL